MNKSEQMENGNLVLTEYITHFHVKVHHWKDRGLDVGWMQQRPGKSKTRFLQKRKTELWHKVEARLC
jgi:hypothetical protein